MIIRLATEADLEAMTAVLIGASPMDPVYPYRFPDRHLYLDEFAALCRQKCAEYLETSTVVVCEMPSDAYGFGGAAPVVAFSAWDMPGTAQRRHSSTIKHSSPTTPSSTFPGALGDLTRQSAFRAALAEHKARLFDEPYRCHYGQAGQGGHVFLKILLCHPSFQRRGAGTALARWGVEQACRIGVHTTVFASPMGLALYKKLGFREVGRFRVQLEGEGDFVEIPALARAPGVVGSMRAAEGDGLGLCRGRVGECEGGVFEASGTVCA